MADAYYVNEKSNNNMPVNDGINIIKKPIYYHLERIETMNITLILMV